MGKRGITEIKEKLTFPAEDCQIKYYEIYKNDKLIAEMHHFSEVIYFE